MNHPMLADRPLSISDPQPLRPLRAVELDPEWQLLCVAMKLPPAMIRLVAAAYSLPKTVQAHDPLLEAGRRIAEKARGVHTRLVDALRDAAPMRSADAQTVALDAALRQSDDEFRAFVLDIEGGAPGATHRVIEATQGFVADRQRESLERARNFNPMCHWDFVLGKWSNRASVVAAGHALPGIDLTFNGFVREDDF